MSNNQIKILLLGLSNSGKTSIVLTLQKETNLLTYASLKATKGIKRDEFEDDGTIYHIWDFGGQEQYRKVYLEKFDTYLTGTQKVIFVIDVQEKEKFKLALNYYREIVKRLEDMDAQIQLSVFLHKCDPNFEIEDKELLDLSENFSENIPKKFNFSIFKTSIFTVFYKVSLQ